MNRTIHRTAWQITAVILLVDAGGRLINSVFGNFLFSQPRYSDSGARSVFVSSAICRIVLSLAVSAVCYYISLRPRQSEIDREVKSGGDHRLWLVLGLRLIAILLIATAIPKAIVQIALAIITSIPEARDAYLAALAEPITTLAIGGILAAFASKYGRKCVQPDNNG